MKGCAVWSKTDVCTCSKATSEVSFSGYEKEKKCYIVIVIFANAWGTAGLVSVYGNALKHDAKFVY